MNENSHQRTTPQDARMIAEWVRQIRPTWDTPGIMAALRQRADSQPARLALAALACAASKEAKYPNVIAMDGTHWRVGQDMTPADRHPSHISVVDMCWECGRSKDDHPWTGCAKWTNTAHAHCAATDEYIDHLAAARAALAAGRDGYRTTTTHQRKDTA